MLRQRPTSQPGFQAYWSLHKSMDHTMEWANGVKRTDRAVSKNAQLGDELDSTVNSLLLQTVYQWTERIGRVLPFCAFAVECCFRESVIWNKTRAELLSFFEESTTHVHRLVDCTCSMSHSTQEPFSDHQHKDIPAHYLSAELVAMSPHS